MKWQLLDIFSGIGGFSKGLEDSGNFETVAFCEIEKYPQKVLRKHWPHVPIYDDIRTLTSDSLATDGIRVDAICGGFPCQDVSHAGSRGGLEAERSGLWSEYARLIGELRPKIVVVENVSGLLSLGMGRVLGDLSERGYYAEWRNIPALMVGAPIGGNASGLWPTPRNCTAMAATITPASAWEPGRFPNLETMVGRSIWPTPQASDHKNRGGWGSGAVQMRLEKGRQIMLSMVAGGQLNPMWVEWLMGFPLGWTALEDSETPSSPKSPNSSEGQ